MEERLHILGIRHHGPGSAASVEQALDELNPSVVLIEGPTDATQLIKFASTPGMRPPVALLLYPKGYPEAARFFPFAEFSPEWCAMLWATKHGKPVEFIDLPVQASVVEKIEQAKAAAAQIEAGSEDEKHSDNDTESFTDNDEADDSDDTSEIDEADQSDEPDTGEHVAEMVAADPLNALAEIAGHSDGESWWNAIVEQSVQSPAVFDAIHTAMSELRLQVGEKSQTNEREEQREAHMRTCIRKALKSTKGEVAVICGAWHTPALKELDKYSATADKDILKNTKSTPCNSCWIPWTDQRLAFTSGYGAGVVSPGWYRHLWGQHKKTHNNEAETARWQSRVASLLRDEGYDASTASVIEATRLTQSITAVRGLPAPGLIEMQDASLAALCHGEPAPLQLINAKLVIGNRVGAVDESVPQPPLLADLAQQQKKHRIKPEALGREIKLDLRSVSGMSKSELLHRLNLLDVGWGKLSDGQAGRGTFREVWYLQWEPEHAVALAEAVVYGPTVALASAALAVAKAQELTNAEDLANLVRQCLLANLPEAVSLAVKRLQTIAATSAQVTSLMAVLPPLADIQRYGTARDMPVHELGSLVRCIGIEVNSGFRYATRQLDDEAAQQMRQLTRRYDHALELVGEAYLTEGWQTCLKEALNDERAAPLVRGLATRLLHNKQVVELEQTANTLSRSLAPAIPVLDAGAWLEGFIDESGEVFLHDDELFIVVDQWLQAAPEESFIEILPMMRRSFSDFDAVLRRRLMQRLTKTAKVARSSPVEQSESSIGASAFEQVLPLLAQLVELPE